MKYLEGQRAFVCWGLGAGSGSDLGGGLISRGEVMLLLSVVECTRGRGLSVAANVHKQNKKKRGISNKNTAATMSSGPPPPPPLPPPPYQQGGQYNSNQYQPFPPGEFSFLFFRRLSYSSISLFQDTHILYYDVILPSIDRPPPQNKIK